jgi:hypothetical protein
MPRCVKCGELMTVGSRCECALEHDMSLLAEENARLLAENDNYKRQVLRLMGDPSWASRLPRRKSHE